MYRRYGLLDDAGVAGLIADPVRVPELKLGERAFEIVLARRMAAGEIETQWFERHRSTPITEIPAHWPEPYKAVVAKRIETIENRRDIGLIDAGDGRHHLHRLADDNLYAINPDGSLKWKFTTGVKCISSPAVGADGTIYVGS